MTRDLNHKQFLRMAERHGFEFTSMNGLGAWLKDLQQGGNVLHGCILDGNCNIQRRASLAKAFEHRKRDLEKKQKRERIKAMPEEQA